MFMFGTPIHPVRWLGKLIVRVLVGAFLLFLLNVIGESFSLHVPINLVTAAISGVLGIPGVAVLVLIKYTMGI
ncbi:pro-sigmaK processing inhibitor BofA [Sporolactobacillus sp. THM7-4]|nr:pro-sigmaK processing inhibitor BofA [Sporolactobacillus sp. THM7-4]